MPDKSIAGVLLSGILSDTIGLRMSTTPKYDRDAVAWLAPIAGIDPVKYADELIMERMALSGTSQTELLERDSKEFNLSSKRIVISQILIPTFKYVHSNEAEIYAAFREKLRDGCTGCVYCPVYKCY